ncbi:MAG: hypothetical protein J5I52_01430 [Saprospiraceae bacterium]|nr:MAG: mannose-6-phosphate isomerase [Bacteroidetes bacterium OLB9]MCO6462788.1 hypothetical protein [Saprospiraceae bacterium]MCZ2338366.1 hypothetical protein [Chitinophagales bacterium]
MDYKIFRLNKIKKQIQQLELNIVDADLHRPWGGFFRIDEADTPQFIDHFFPELKNQLANSSEKLSPKILCVAPRKQLSWQYHDRRSEFWKLLSGKAYFKISTHDHETEAQLLQPNAILHIPQGQRHRLIGSHIWAFIAEIWQHTDPDHPSDEADIIRLQDEYGR